MEKFFFLCIETSSPICSVAIGRGKQCVEELKSDEPNGHAKHLAGLIDQIMRNNAVNFDDLCAITVNAGPGSYTGLRIGMSTAKGLCYATEKPLIAISAFDSMVQSFLRQYKPAANDWLLPMIDARRMEVYTQLYNAQGKPLDKQKAYIDGEENLLPTQPSGKLWLFGSGAEKMLPGFSEYDSQAIPDTFLSAAGLLGPATARGQDKQFDDIAYTVPNYGKSWQKI